MAAWLASWKLRGGLGFPLCVEKRGSGNEPRFVAEGAAERRGGSRRPGVAGAGPDSPTARGRGGLNSRGTRASRRQRPNSPDGAARRLYLGGLGERGIEIPAHPEDSPHLAIL